MNGKEKREEKYSADNKINNITARKLMAAPPLRCGRAQARAKAKRIAAALIAGQN